MPAIYTRYGRPVEGRTNKFAANYFLIMKDFLKPVFTLLLLAGAQFSFAWGVTGHRVIAEIAQSHLSEKSKAAISQLIGIEKLAQ